MLEKLKQNLRNYRDVMNDDGARATLIAVNDVEKAPTIDAEPVVHGHWEETGRFEKDGVNYICYRCSICGGLHRERRKQTGNPNSIGCPHCRAKMDEEQG